MHLFIFASKTSNMEARFITDTDFVPSEHYLLDTYNEVFQIEYELLYDKPNYDRTYANIVRLSKKQQSPILRKAKMLMWRNEIGRALKSLKGLVMAKAETWVVVPITNYEEQIETTLQQFDFASIVLNELCSNENLQNVEKEQVKDDFVVPSMYELFVGYMIDLQTEIYVGDDSDWYLRVCVDEMLRRGLRDKKKMIEAGWRGVENNNPPFEPSEHYEDEGLWIELFATKGDKLDKFSVETLARETGEDVVRAESNKKVKCGVFFYALHDKVDEYTLTALINYACNVTYNNKVKKRNTNSIEKYLRLFKKFNMSPTTFYSDDLKPNVVEDVMTILRDYELEMPQLLNGSKQ